jgi:hypothetical protein
MIAAATLDNMLAWLVQVSVIASLGALLPTLLRIRHPKSQLAYYHVILVLCFALPFIQPWQHKLLVITRSHVGDPVVTGQIPWAGLILGIVGLGAAAKLLWLGIGLWQLRRYRRFAITLCPVPQPIRDARLFTGTDAQFCVSRDVAGPATMGYFDPVVLLPASFHSLDEDAQRSVACHELLHVRRRDWLVTLLEEVAGSLLWFHPAIRWLLGRARLTREQLVDAEVVRMNPPAPYIEALLSMAVVSGPRLALPAAPFFTEGHLAHRMRALLESPRRTLTRLCISYASIALVFALAGWTILILFPLNGEAHVFAPRLHGLVTYQIATTGKRLFIPPQVPRSFNLPVPIPADRSRDVLYFMNVEASDPAPGQAFEMKLPPPPPPPPPPDGLPIRAIGRVVRVMRPGFIASPEQIQNFIASFPPEAVVQVIQEDDGTVQKVMITRSSADAATFNTFGPIGVLGGFAGPTPTAGPANGEH